MKIKKVLAMCLISAMVLGSFAGCGKDEGESTVSVNQEDPAWKEAMTTPYGKYPETVNYTLGKTVTNFDVLDGTKYEGDDDENNAWTRYLKEKLNVQNTNLFEANDGDDYEQKVSMAIVSGEIPDIMGVGDYDTLKQLYENDLIADLTEVYENCASDKIKEIYDSYDGVCLKTAMFDGKLMGLPTTEISHGPGILWLRKDWMDKCGLEEPKTMEDIYNILEQFLVQDPGGNGEGKTVGLVIDPQKKYECSTHCKKSRCNCTERCFVWRRCIRYLSGCQLRGRLSEQCFNSCILGKCFRFFPDSELFQQPVKGYHTGQHRQRSILRKSGRLQRCGIRYAFYRIHHK